MVLATAPAAAAAEPQFLKPLGWYADESAVPVSVEFKDVAAAGSTVVAVGNIPGTGEPVIFSRSGGGWQEAPVDPPLPAVGSLDDVVLGDANGWAVGTAGEQPLVLELADGVWRDRSASVALPAAPSAVALNGAGAVIGDRGGGIHRVAPGGATTHCDPAAGAGAIHGITVFSGSSGLAVAGYKQLVGEPPDNSVRFYTLGDCLMLDPEEQSSAGHQVEMTGLAAHAPNHGFAIDSSNRTWRLTRALGQNDWIEEPQLLVPAEGSRLDAVASVKGGRPPWDGAGWGTEFVAGNEASQGAIWQRRRWTKDFAAWKRDELPAGTLALTGVTATAWDAAWAVGSGGTILHYCRPPDPEAEQAWRDAEEQRRLEEQQQQQQQQQDGGGSAPAGESQTEQKQTTIVTLGEWRPVDSGSLEPGEERLVTNGVVVEDGQLPTGQRKRLVKNVRAIFRRVRSGRRELIVKFRLTRRARVRVSAKRGRDVIAKSRARTLRRGRRKVVLPVRGTKPPTSLKLVARPAPKAT